ncbi:MAG: L-threonylcarbamoyladenylate synthase [bacterium]
MTCRQTREEQEGVDISGAVAALEAGFLVVFPTDTVYGVAADPRVNGARDKLYEAKKREPRKPIAILVSDAAVAMKMGAEFSAPARRLADRFWPGPLTIVLPVGDGFEGFRVPGHPVVLALLNAVGGALYTTSANISGSPPARSAAEACEALAPFVKAALDGAPVPGGKESTVVKVDGAVVTLLREGAVPWSEIELCTTRR